MGKTYFFGTGNLYGIDTSITPPTPVKFGTLQEVSVEFSFTLKELHGQMQFADAVARAEGKITGKAKSGQIKGDMLGTLFFGLTPATGQVLPISNEAGIIPATPGPYTITVAHGANFRTDLGVVFAITGNRLTRVTAPPATGQYSVDVATGIYTFAAADQGKAVKFDYLYNAAAAGKTITIVNEEQGEAPSFLVILSGSIDGKSVVLILNKCKSSKLNFPTKKGDFAIPEFDFSAMSDDADEIGLLSLPE